jgi:rSAM/selenodomain-associated transferase 1
MPLEIEAVGIAIFAKAPVPGYAKTRLIPRLGAAGAADLQRRLIVRTVETGIGAALGPVSLWCAPGRDHELFRGLGRDFGLTLFDQKGQDLGARMLLAFQALAPAGPLLLIGTDCPALTSAHLRQCAQALKSGYDAVFVPAEDGGYVLVGLRRPEPALFEDLDWSTPKVMAQTRARAARAGLRWSEPLTLWDVDVPADLERLEAVECCRERPE